MGGPQSMSPMHKQPLVGVQATKVGWEKEVREFSDSPGMGDGSQEQIVLPLPLMIHHWPCLGRELFSLFIG